MTAPYDAGHENVTGDPACVLGTPYNLRSVAAGDRIDVLHSGGGTSEINGSGSQGSVETGGDLQSNPAKEIDSMPLRGSSPTRCKSRM